MSFNFLDKTGLSYVISKIKSKLSPVALSGDYEDLSNLPALASGNYFGTSTGQAALQNKAVVVSADQNFELKVGCVVAVKFDASNTYSATASAPVTMNVNNTGAKQIYYGNLSAPTGSNKVIFGHINYVMRYMYDGTYWVWAGFSAENDTRYSAMSVNELKAGTATNLRTVRADYLKTGINNLISTALQILNGGTTDQVLTKNSNDDLDFKWTTGGGGGGVTPSHVGQIIQSTTLDTLAKVQAIYGSNTTWIQHSGYVLRGATSGVVANSKAKTGGSDNSIVVSHSHSIDAQSLYVSGANHQHYSSSYGPTSSYGEGYNSAYVGWTSPSLTNIRSSSLITGESGALSMSGTLAAHNTNSTGSDGTNANIPNYKSVYIWERTA